MFNVFCMHTYLLVLNVLFIAIAMPYLLDYFKYYRRYIQVAKVMYVEAESCFRLCTSKKVCLYTILKSACKMLCITTLSRMSSICMSCFIHEPYCISLLISTRQQSSLSTCECPPFAQHMQPESMHSLL